MQARYYAPVIGRFYSNDPKGLSNVHNFNRYAYANNNPYKHVDPDGQIAKLVKAVFNAVRKVLSQQLYKKHIFSNAKNKITVGKMVYGEVFTQATSPAANIPRSKTVGVWKTN